MDDEFGIAGNCNGGEKANYKNPFPGGVPTVNKPGKPKGNDAGGGGPLGGAGGGSGGEPDDQSSSPEDILRELAPFTTSEACNYFLDEVTCNPETWQFLSDPSYLQSVQLSLQNSCLGDFWSCYDPDAVIFGGSLSGSSPGIYRTGGLELLEMTSDGALAFYGYGGDGYSAGLGANGSVYIGAVFNLNNPDSYIGQFGAAGVAVSVFTEGVTLFYFWDSTQAPLEPGVTQGIAVGWAPGAGASVWSSITNYVEIASSAP